MSGYWEQQLSNHYACGNCGGELRNTGAVPVVKGSLTSYKCIRCSSTGTVEDKITYDGVRTSGCVVES
jgi:DNA-directed RNA polymerase subunit RPC12/RpoP